MSAAGPIIPVIVNMSGGAARRAGADLPGRIGQAFAEAGRTIDLDLVGGGGVRTALERHAGAPRIVVGGGDGTVQVAAQSLAESGGELAVLPLGTRNHFAREVGIPLGLADAVRLAATGTARRVDLGQAGGRVFVNNLSAGTYVVVVRERQHAEPPKLLATPRAAWRALRHLRTRTFRLAIDGEPCTVETPLLFIGNNRYEVKEGRPGERVRLDGGRLWCYAVAPLSRLGFLSAALRLLVGRPRMHRDFVLDRLAHTVRIDPGGKSLEVALDGERTRFDLPLAIRVLPGALAIVAPPPHG